MNSQPSGSVTPRQIVGLLATHRKLWLVPTVLCTVAAAAYSLVAPRYWQASQALVVRQETAGGASTHPGKFADLYEMRTLQETILELAKSQQVVVATLQAVDRRKNSGAPVAPTAEDIEQFRRHLKMLPPEGGEFGKTEVFYFCVEDTDRDRAIELVGELCLQLDVGLKQLRSKRAESLINELEQQVATAGEMLAEETKRLVEFESKVGPDLGELRMLHSAQSGQSDLRQEVVQVETDSRKFQTQVREGLELVSLLKTAENDPLTLVATPNSLLASQPALRRLKDGLVDAQLATARLAGTRSPDHPRVRAAVEAEEQVREDLHHELVTAIRGAEVELSLSQQRLKATQDRLANLQGRLSKLAELRAGYSNRVAAVDNSRISLDHARDNLSAAKAALAAAHSGSLVTRLDRPETGPYPAGLGRTVITGAGGVAGLMLGLGLVFLSVAPRAYGRRATDRPTAAVPPVVTPVATPPVRASSAPIAASPQWDDAWITSSTASAEPIKPSVPAPLVKPQPVVNSKSQQLPQGPVRQKQPAAPPKSVKAAAPLPPSPVLPATPGALPVGAASGSYGGLTLQEALHAAQRLQS